MHVSEGTAACVVCALQYIYCNVEGIEWLDDYRLVISSDKAKKDQPFRCTAKDQMVSIFALPG